MVRGLACPTTALTKTAFAFATRGLSAVVPKSQNVKHVVNRLQIITKHVITKPDHFLSRTVATHWSSLKIARPCDKTCTMFKYTE